MNKIEKLSDDIELIKCDMNVRKLGCSYDKSYERFMELSVIWVYTYLNINSGLALKLKINNNTGIYINLLRQTFKETFIRQVKLN